ncbi:MAG: ATP-binding protein [Candidatus Aenigmarchaeota archaeon]|nr:ATP-binding protein [Candidatus Aenigmarchaeota archaeon]
MKLQLTIRKKLFLFSTFFISLVILLNYFNIYLLERAHQNMNLVVYEYEPVLASANSLKSSALTYRLNLDEYLFTGSDVYLQSMETIKKRCEEEISFLENRSIEKIELLSELKSSFSSYFLLTENLINFYKTSPKDLETINIKKSRIDSLLGNAILSKLNLLLNYQEAKILDTLEEFERLHSSSLITSTLLIFLLMCVSIIYSFLISKSIIDPLKEVEEATKKIAKGNFGLEIEVKTEDELGKLALNFNEMSRKLLEFKRKVESHQKELERTVRERTKELDKKVKELTETKIALMNMMEDLNETNKKLLEAQKKLKKSYKELKKLDVEKDRFISVAAHELKTPMAAISGFAQILQDEEIIKDKEKREKYLKIINEEIKRLSKLVDDVLDLSRIDLGTIKILVEEVKIDEILKEVKDEMTGLAKGKGLYLNVKIERELPNIITDKEKLKRILLNLVSNAIKYTEKGGVTIKAEREDNEIKFSVSDTGIGIPKEYFSKIFTRFYQIESPYTRKVKGSGLGLSICKELVELLGGKIWLESEVGKGSTFYFTLPLKHKENK